MDRNPLACDHGAGPLASASAGQLLPVAITLSGFSEMEEMPSSASHCAKSGWSLGPWPQMPMYSALGQAGLDGLVDQHLDSRVALVKVLRQQSRPESRSRPRVSWVRSLEPMEKPSKNSGSARPGWRCWAPRTS